MLCDWEEGVQRPRALPNFIIWFFLPTTARYKQGWGLAPLATLPSLGELRYVWKRGGLCQGKHLPCQADQQMSFFLQSLHPNPPPAKTIHLISANSGATKCQAQCQALRIQRWMCLNQACFSSHVLENVHRCFPDPKSNVCRLKKINFI